ncbi:uncharacterized protein LOC120686826 isoform X1 [Panicum virgatum]|uniref:Uncharacterized protein n=1 Tax=Panicum virgatum TaxID=38727 RepID=A0A8T0P3E5_PANVG|nr:uncharacterized protein LOC120686826 isoform X1 [Panicum virgatum]KAG2556577.1 hypothetical protein PVAP13_8NG198100 [Panicum virgatum]
MFVGGPLVRPVGALGGSVRSARRCRRLNGAVRPAQINDTSSVRSAVPPVRQASCKQILPLAGLRKPWGALCCIFVWSHALRYHSEYHQDCRGLCGLSPCVFVCLRHHTSPSARPDPAPKLHASSSTVEQLHQASDQIPDHVGPPVAHPASSSGLGGSAAQIGPPRRQPETESIHQPPSAEQRHSVVDLGLELLSQVLSGPPSSADNAEDATAQTSIQLAAVTPHVPLLDAALSLAGQQKLWLADMDLKNLVVPFTIATLASIVWRRAMYFLFVHCELKLPALPAWIAQPHVYTGARPAMSLYPLRWFCSTLYRHMKLCITSGMLSSPSASPPPAQGLPTAASPGPRNAYVCRPV